MSTHGTDAKCQGAKGIRTDAIQPNVIIDTYVYLAGLSQNNHLDLPFETHQDKK